MMLDADHLTDMTVHELLQADAMVSFRTCATQRELTEREDDIAKLRAEFIKRGLIRAELRAH